jgi:UDP-glucuronate decarboxylase
LLRHDITLPLFVEVDAILNLACPASPIHYQRDPVQTTKTSFIGAIRCACARQALADQGVAGIN